MRVEFFGGVDAGGDGSDAGTDGTCAANVCGCVADDPECLCRKLFLEASFDVLECIAGDIITVRMMITIGATGKKMVDLEVSEFDPGTFGIVASEEAEVNAWESTELLKEWLDAGEQTAGKFAEAMGEPFKVCTHETVALFGGQRDSIAGKDFVFDTTVRSTGGVNFIKGFGDAKFVAECQFHGALPGAAGSEHGAIDVEEQDRVSHV